MPNTIDTIPANQLVTLVTFITPVTTYRYCIWTDDLTVGADSFTSLPEMEVTLPKLTGGFNEEVTTILMPILKEPLKTMLKVEPFAFVDVEIEECDPNDAIATRQWLARGEVTEVLSNGEGRTGLAEVKIASLKNFANIPLGILCTSLCAWTFGDSQCQVDVAAIRETGTMSAISGNTVTVTGLTTTGISGYWRYGYVEKDGIRILIKNYITGNVFELVKRPPAAWVGTSVTLTPGCDKTIDTCKTRWNNESQHGGLGRQMPEYHPLMESPKNPGAS